MIKSIIVCLLIISSQIACSPFKPQKKTDQNWTHRVRTAGHGLNKNNIEATIKDAQETHLFGIEVDNDIPGRYESFLDPAAKLEALELMAKRAHEINNHAFVYIAGLECITPNAGPAGHTFFKDHPDWVQRDINDRPAMFGGGDAFWISNGDEDVWISPYAMEWRKKFMEHIRKIAATGIDGIFVDVPYWMTHFDGWGDSWASFDEYTVEAFRKKTGLDAKKDLKLGDFSDANFRKWVSFRISSLTDFMAEVAQNAKSVNPECKTIAEIYPGIGDEAVRVGADVYELYDVVDVIAHEFSGGGGNASAKNPLNWFDRMAGIYAFRAFAEGKASWMLSYSWDKENKVSPVEPMKNLALSNLMAGANHWDARGHVMSGSNDIATRKIIYKWIADHEDTFYKPRKEIKPVGVYFSPVTRNYYADAFIASFQGMMKMMLQGHMEFQIVTPRTLKDFKGDILVLPDVKCVSREEMTALKKYLNGNKGLVVTGETGRFDEQGNAYAENPVLGFLEIGNPRQEIRSANADNRYIYYPDCPGKVYSGLTDSEFNEAAWSGSYQDADFYSFINKFKSDISEYFGFQFATVIEASPFISSQSAIVEGKPHVFLANFSGLKSDEVVDQRPESNIKISFSGMAGSKIFYLPFLGEKQLLDSRFENGRVACVLPAVGKGGVIWLEN